MEPPISVEKRDLEALLEVSRQMVAVQDLDQLLDLVLGHATELLDAERSSLFVLNEDTGELWTTIAQGLVGRTIRGQNRSLKTCYGDASARNPDLGRRVDLRLTVDGRGRASGVRVTSGSPVQDSGLERCLVGALEKATFPEARNGTKTFDYPISF